MARWFKKEFGVDTDALIVLDALIKAEEYIWANWLIVRLFKRKQKLQYSLFSAELALPIFEAKFPENTRFRQAIEAVKKVMENDTPENRNAAANAAYAVSAAYAAVYYAACAAADAANADANAANAAKASVTAAYAARAADYAEVDAAAAGKETLLKIFEYGKGLLSEDG